MSSECDADGEEGEVDQQVPEEHGGQQPVGIGEQAGNESLPVSSDSKRSEVISREEKQGGFAGREEAAGQEECGHCQDRG